jgi:hypothetical protein
MFMSRKYKLMDEANGGEGGEGAGGGEDLKAQLEALQAENESLSNKVNELLGEAKKAKKQRREAEAAAEEERKKKAEAEGNYQQLFESSEKERGTLAAQLEELQGNIAKKEVNASAMQIATRLAEGENVGLLSEFIARRLKFTDDGIKVTDSAGNLTVSTLQDLEKEFSGSARYASLIRGKQSSGGGASGGSGGSSATKTMTREEFDALEQHKRKSFIKDGGKVVNH